MPRRTNTYKLPRLSVPEWRIFHVFSTTGPSKVRDIIPRLSALFPDERWVYAPVLTYTQRLADKGYLAQLPSKRGLPNQYAAAADYGAALRLHVEHFLTGFCVTAEDVASVRAILDEFPAART